MQKKEYKINLSSRINQIKDGDSYMSPCNCMMTNKPIFDNKQDGLNNMIQSNINKSFVIVDLERFYMALKKNKSFKSVRLTIYNNRLYMEFEDYLEKIRHMIGLLDDHNEQIENNTSCKYSIQYLLLFLKGLKKKDFKQYRNINLSFNTDGLLFLDYGDYCILAPRVEND